MPKWEVFYGSDWGAVFKDGKKVWEHHDWEDAIIWKLVREEPGLDLKIIDVYEVQDAVTDEHNQFANDPAVFYAAVAEHQRKEDQRAELSQWYGGSTVV